MGLVAALLVPVGTEVLFCNNWQQQERYGADQPERSQQPSARLARRYPNPREYKPKCDSPESKDEADVCAQREMAKGTSRLVNLARCQTGIGHASNMLLFLAFAAALWAAVEAWKIGEATSKQVSNSDDSYRTLERAYIVVEPYDISDAKQRNKYEPLHLVSHLGIANRGRLPARHVRWSIDIVGDASGDRSDFPIPDSFEGDNVIQQGVSMRLGTKRIPYPTVYLDRDDYYIYVWGEVRYNDGFDTPRWVRFCHRYNMRSYDSAEGSIAPWDARHHKYGNDAN